MSTSSGSAWCCCCCSGEVAKGLLSCGLDAGEEVVEGCGEGIGSANGQYIICVNWYRVGANEAIDSPLWRPPPSPVILFSLALPPALIFASRRSLRMRACSAARAAAASSGLIPVVSTMMGVGRLVSVSGVVV